MSKQKRGTQIYEKKSEAKTTPRIETPEIAIVDAPFEFEVLEGPAPLRVEVTTTPPLPVETTTEPEAPDAAAPEGVGRAVKISALEWVTQLDEAGMRAVKGIDVMGPRDSGG